MTTVKEGVAHQIVFDFSGDTPFPSEFFRGLEGELFWAGGETLARGFPPSTTKKTVGGYLVGWKPPACSLSALPPTFVPEGKLCLWYRNRANPVHRAQHSSTAENFTKLGVKFGDVCLGRPELVRDIVLALKTGTVDEAIAKHLGETVDY